MTPADQRREWARTMLARCSGPVAIYGSPEWLALPDASSEKVAALVRAAERYAVGVEADDLQRDAELAAAAAQLKAAEDAAYVARREAHRATWGTRAGSALPDPQIAAEVEQDWRAWARGEVA